MHARHFACERDDDGALDETTANPLARAIEWIEQVAVPTNRRQSLSASTSGDEATTFLVLANEISARARDYTALDMVALRRWATTPTTARHAAEVVWQPAKLYADIDMHWPSNPDAETIFDAFVDRLVGELERRFRLSASPLVLDASRVGEKFSRHLVVAMHRGGEPVAFASGADCGRFVRSVERAHRFDAVNVKRTGERTPLCDPSVYHRRSCFRTYGSTKREALDRVLVPLVGSDERRRHDACRAGTIDVGVLEQSLITYPRVTSTTHWLYVDVAADDVRTRSGSRLGAPKRSLSMSSSSSSSSSSTTTAAAMFTNGVDERIEAAIRDNPIIADAEIDTIRASGDGTFVRVRCHSRLCARAGREHTSNKIYFLVDVRRRRAQQRCFSPSCRDQPACPWFSLDGGGDGSGASPSPPPPLPLPPTIEVRPRSTPPALDTARSTAPVYGDAIRRLFSMSSD